MRVIRLCAMSFMPCMFFLNELARCDEALIDAITPAQLPDSVQTALPAQSASMSG